MNPLQQNERDYKGSYTICNHNAAMVPSSSYNDHHSAAAAAAAAPVSGTENSLGHLR